MFERFRKLCATLLILALTACGTGVPLTRPKRVARQDLAGSTYVTVLSIAPWDEYVDLLQPKFNLTAEDALTKALPTTAAEDERFLQSLSAALKIATPKNTETTRKVTGDTNTSSTTKEQGPGVISEVTHATELDASTLPTGTTAVTTASLEKEPMLQYLVATALFQEVQLLSRFVKNAATRKQLVPYVVRLQITLMPEARNEPYDAYSNVSFFYGAPTPRDYSTPSTAVVEQLQLIHERKLTPPAKLQRKDGNVPPPSKEGAPPLNVPSKDESSAEKTASETGSASTTKAPIEWTGHLPCSEVPAPVISPLFVTDNLEGTIHGQTSQYIRQLTASVLLLSNNFAGTGTGRFKSDFLRTMLARDVNSLLTVGRLNDNTLRVRLGAIQAATGSYSMTPQTHNVTLLLMVPDKKDLGPQCEPDTLRFVSKTTFVDALTGQSLPERGVATEAALIRRLIDVMDGYGIKVRWNPLQEVRAKYLNLVLFAATNNRQGFRWQFDDLMQSEARNACHEPPDKARLFRPCLSQFTWDVLEDGIWMELVNLTTGSPWHIGTVELPYVEPPKLPPPQPIVIADDGKKAAVITIASGARLLREGLDAKLTVTDGLATQTFLPAQVEVGSNGESLKLTFTTPAKFFDTPKTANYSLSLAYPDNPRKKYDRTASVGPVVFPTALVKYSAPEPETPSSQPVKMKITSTIIRAVNGEGKLNIEFERDPKATEVVRFDVRGGDIAEMIATPTTMFPAGKPPRTIGGSGIVMLTLRNLSDANTITVTTTKIDKGTETQLDLQMLSVRDAAPPRQDRGTAGQ